METLLIKTKRYEENNHNKDDIQNGSREDLIKNISISEKSMNYFEKHFSINYYFLYKTVHRKK